MHWEVLIIPLIALGVWILGTVFRGEEERPSSPLRRSNAPGRPTQRRPVTDLDQFLEEARRRREAGQRQAPIAPPRAPAPARPAAPPRLPQRERVPTSQPPRPPRPSARPGEGIPTAAPPPATPANLPEAVPVAELVRPRRDEPSPVYEVTSVIPQEEGAPPKEKPVPLVNQLRAMLRQPQSAALAFALREILDRPLSQRR